MKIGYKHILCSLLLVGIFYFPTSVKASSLDTDKLIDLTNTLRTQNSLPYLQYNEKLALAARAKAEAIMQSGQFAHDFENKKFSSWIKETNYEYSHVGENLAIDFTDSQSVIDAWLASPEHRKNILNPDFTEIGIAVLSGKFQGENTYLVVQIFGHPLQNPMVLGQTENNMGEKFSLLLKDAHINNPFAHNSFKYIILITIFYALIAICYFGSDNFRFFTHTRNRITGRNRQLKLPLG